MTDGTLPLFNGSLPGRELGLLVRYGQLTRPPSNKQLADEGIEVAAVEPN
jgi:hypothetical protein